MKVVGVVALIALALAMASVLAVLVGGQIDESPDCYDGPCSGAHDALIIWGSLGAIGFGTVAAIAGLVWTLARLLRRRG